MVKEFVTSFAAASILGGGFLGIQGHIQPPQRVFPPIEHSRVAPNQSPAQIWACIDPNTNRITEAAHPIAGQVCENEVTDQAPVASSVR